MEVERRLSTLDLHSSQKSGRRQPKPPGFRYATYRLDDGVSFVHVASVEQGPAPLTQLEAFKRFQEGIEERCEESPNAVEVSRIGSFDSP